jgi:hypothetical protein
MRMRRLRTPLVGIEQGSRTLFSDFEDDGPMWSGTGPREARLSVVFSERFRAAPVVHLGDVDVGHRRRHEPARGPPGGGDHGDGLRDRVPHLGRQPVARIRADWIAIGELSGEDDWEMY